MLNKKKIVFITGTRADYGKLTSIIGKLSKNKKFQIHIFVTGMHLLKKYDSTYKHVVKDYKLSTKIKFSKNQESNDTQDIILSKTVLNFSKYVSLINPDLIIVHGDRLEALAGSIVGTMRQYLVAHIEGGEISGTVDEHLRHAISKLSHIHFVANNTAKKILENMGEDKKVIFNVGSPDIDIMISKNLPSLSDVRKRYAINFENYAIGILHPVTTLLKKLPKEAKIFCNIIKKSNKKFIIIYPNNDPGNEIILKSYQKYLRKNSRIRIIKSMRFEHFITLLKYSKFIIGNSSVGIREAPYFGVPTIDLGDRQKFRARSKSVKNIECDEKKILNYIYGIKKKFKRSFQFGYGDSTKKITAIINSKKFWKINLQKHFVKDNNQ